MRLSTLFGSALLAIGLLTQTSNAHAQTLGDLTLRLEPSVALPVGNPQDNRFLPGFEGSAKVGVSLLPYLDVGPGAGWMLLPSNISGTSDATATFLGGFARLHRSHTGTATDITALAPWVEADLDYVRTGPLDRMSYSFEVGAALPTSRDHNIWIGPFAALQTVFQGTGHPGFDTTDDKTLLVGLSVEFGAKHKAPPAPIVVHEVVQEVVPCPPAPTPTVVAEKAPQLDYTIRFPFNSDELKPSQQNILDQVSATVARVCHNDCQVEVEGYASSEGQLAHNNALSKKRADAAAAYMESKGVLKNAAISSAGRGIDSPVGDNKSAAGRAANRRAEVVIRIVKGTK